MARIELHSVGVDFPVYNVNARSFKKQFLRLATGGAVLEDTKHHVIVNALSNVTVSLKNGDRLALIGHNGAGKSTLLRLMAKIYEPTHGEMYVEGNISPMFGFMQGIEAESTGYENIVMRGTLLGLSRKQINKHMVDIAELTGLGDYLNMPTRTYSSGMMVRLAFAISTSINPEILLVDEVFGAGDASFMKKAQQKMSDLLNQSRIVVMANHSDALLKEFCNKALLLEGGAIKFCGSVDQALDIYYGKDPGNDNQ